MEGVHLASGLPNTTSDMQEMDDWFQDLKVKSDSNAQEIFQEHMFQYSLSLMSYSNDGKTEVKTATLSNDDIPRIIHGRPNDPIEKKPFSLMLPQGRFSIVG